MAADAFRIPYWDWALGQQGEEFPDIFTTPLATVIGPDGNQQTIPNPLYQYQFHPASSSDFESPWAQMNTTLRCPTSHAFDAESQQQMVRAHYMTYRRGIHDGVAKAFSSATYNAFASELEIHHGTVHFLAGCMDPYAGHFWDTEYSAFDPIFMIVHANADRLMAMYQAAHPNNWVEPKNSGETGNFWIPNFSNLHADLPMPPFWKDGQNFYTPNDIRNVSVLGYAYPETQYWLYPTTEYWRMAVNESIARYYSPSARGTLTALSDMGSSSTTHLLADTTFTDWIIKTKTPVLDLPSKFYVVFSFVGLPSPEKSIEVGTWTRQTTGRRDTQARSHYSVNRNRRSYAHNQPDLENTISLTSSLLDQVMAGNLKSLSAADVVPYLTKHLTWQVITGKDLIQGKMQDITVEVLSTEVRIPDDPTQALEYSSHSTPYPEVTDKQ
ncbi:unnamed protein product [Periconia digitata]|uniref:tyrosinase n=1 Tax=Periconia digitata TaxID=1303443 RepID=A0A9W4UC03_9PLEO|nr:unnamed protein product [Periconia digitata]